MKECEKVSRCQMITKFFPKLRVAVLYNYVQQFVGYSALRIDLSWALVRAPTLCVMHVNLVCGPTARNSFYHTSPVQAVTISLTDKFFGSCYAL